MVCIPPGAAYRSHIMLKHCWRTLEVSVYVSVSGNDVYIMTLKDFEHFCVSVTDSLGISPRVRSLSKALDESQAQMKELDAQMKEQEELHKTEITSQQQGFQTTTDQMAKTIAEKDRTIASLSRQYNRLDKTLENMVDDYNQLLAKTKNLEKNNQSLTTLVHSKNHCIRETYLILFDNMEPRSMEKLGDLGLRKLIGNESWEKLKNLDNLSISQSQSIKRGPKL